VRVSVLRAAHALMVHMRDPGKGFSFETIAHAAVSADQVNSNRMPDFGSNLLY